jgi:hypothetical protein
MLFKLSTLLLFPLLLAAAPAPEAAPNTAIIMVDNAHGEAGSKYEGHSVNLHPFGWKDEWRVCTGSHCDPNGVQCGEGWVRMSSLSLLH